MRSQPYLRGSGKYVTRNFSSISGDAHEQLPGDQREGRRERKCRRHLVVATGSVLVYTCVITVCYLKPT